MRLGQLLLAAVLALVAAVAQVTVLSRLPLFGAPPQLAVVVVVGFALEAGPVAGAVSGFLTGLLADLVPPADHSVGRIALVLTLLGYGCGLLRMPVERSAFLPIVAVGGASALAVAGNATVGALLGEGVNVATLVRAVPAATFYDVLLAPFVLPFLAMLLRRVTPDPSRSLV
jgi:rod shape-determining protein MreD